MWGNNQKQNTGITVVAGDFNAKLGYLAESEGNTRGPLVVSADRTDNNDLIQVCFDYKTFLVNANFRYQKPHRHT